MKDPYRPLTVKEAGKLGGTKTRDTHGPDHYRVIGKQGAERVKELIRRGREVEEKEHGKRL